MSRINTPAEREFFDAVSNGQPDAVRAAVTAAPNLLLAYDYDCFGATPLTRACFDDDRAMVLALIELGADVNRRSDWDMGPWPPLHCAITSRHIELAELLLHHGAVLDVHTAAGMRRIGDLNRLLDESPGRVNEPGGDGCRPLHFADSCEVAEVLLDRGADIDARCVDHHSTPVHYLAWQRPEVARFLFSKGAAADIFSAVLAGDRAVVQKLISADPSVVNMRINSEAFPPGPDPEVMNIMAFTIGENTSPLHAAATGNRSAMVELLTDAGQSPNVRGGYDNATPLHTAAWHNHAEVARELIRVGAEIDARSGELHDNTPAGWAIVAGSADVFDVLMDAGAQVHDWYIKDAEAAANGDFRTFKCVAKEQHDRILARVNAN